MHMADRTGGGDGAQARTHTHKKGQNSRSQAEDGKCNILKKNKNATYTQYRPFKIPTQCTFS